MLRDQKRNSIVSALLLSPKVNKKLQRHVNTRDDNGSERMNRGKRLYGNKTDDCNGISNTTIDDKSNNGEIYENRNNYHDSDSVGEDRDTATA